MNTRIILFAAAGGIVLATGASALPLNQLRGDRNVVQAHVVCDVYGRCWHTGGWGHHHHPDWEDDDWDHHHHHDWDDDWDHQWDNDD